MNNELKDDNTKLSNHICKLIINFIDRINIDRVNMDEKKENRRRGGGVSEEKQREIGGWMAYYVPNAQFSLIKAADNDISQLNGGEYVRP